MAEVCQHASNCGTIAVGSPLPAPRALLLDLDGTMYKGGERVEGADRLIARLETFGIPCWFVTNNSSRTPEEVANHLTRLGIAACPEQVVTSALAAADYIGRNHPGGRAYVIGEQGLREALAAHPIRIEAEDSEGEREGFVADLVVQGIDRTFDYGKLTAAVRHIRGGAAHILTNPDLLLPSDGGLLPGAGSLGAAIAAASGKQPIVVGKPSAILMNYALSRANVSPDDVWVVGDNPATDIAAARGAGCPSVLVLTGLCTDADWEDRCRQASAMPDAVCAGLDDLSALLQAQMETKG